MNPLRMEKLRRTGLLVSTGMPIAQLGVKTNPQSPLQKLRSIHRAILDWFAVILTSSSSVSVTMKSSIL